MPCSNCRRLHSQTSIKTPHWYFGNRNTCNFPGGINSRGNYLKAKIRDHEGEDESILTSNQISEMWGQLNNSDRCYYINALIRDWGDKISNIICFLGAQRENVPSYNIILSYKTALTISNMPQNEDHDIISQYNHRERNVIEYYFMKANNDSSDRRRVPWGYAFRHIRDYQTRLINSIQQQLDIPEFDDGPVSVSDTDAPEIQEPNVQSVVLRRALQRVVRRLDRSNEAALRVVVARQEARRANIEAERRSARSSQISNRRFVAPTPSSNLHPSSLCPVCTEDFVSNAGIVNAPCGHQLCVACYSNMVVTTGLSDINCPVCRGTIVNCPPESS